jgi:flagellar biosynthesis chaperone FliJ
MTRPVRTTTAIAAAVLLATVGFATLSGQPERPHGDDVKTLLAEVRALRLTIERAAAQGNQAQLLLGRVQLQENRLATLGRQYDDARRKVLDAQQGEAELEHRLQQIAASPRSGMTPEERDATEAILPSLKNEIARQQSRTAQLRADETAAFNALSGEQQRWAAFNDRLETIERNLSQAAITPP